MRYPRRPLINQSTQGNVFRGDVDAVRNYANFVLAVRRLKIAAEYLHVHRESCGTVKHCLCYKYWKC